MRGKHLVALEEDRFDELPGRTYARAFLRSYASALGLDADRFVAEFDEQVPEPKEPEDLAPPRRPMRRLPFVLAPVAAVVALVAALTWSAWSNDHIGPGTAVAPPPAPVASAAPAVSHVRAAHKTVHAPARLVVRAVGGPCWVLARRGGPAGPVLVERTLAKGETLRFSARHVWLRLGAPWNVRVQRGTHIVVATPAGIRPVNVVA